MLDSFLMEKSLPFMGPAGKYREQRRQNAPALMLAGLMRRCKSLWGATLFHCGCLAASIE